VQALLAVTDFVPTVLASYSAHSLDFSVPYYHKSDVHYLDVAAVAAAGTAAGTADTVAVAVPVVCMIAENVAAVVPAGTDTAGIAD
jgi:hypothetical protein